MDDQNNQAVDSQKADQPPVNDQKGIDIDAVARAIEQRVRGELSKQLDVLKSENAELRKFKDAAANRVETPEEFQKRLQQLNDTHTAQLKIIEEQKRMAEENLQKEKLAWDIKGIFSKNLVEERDTELLHAFFRGRVGRDNTGGLVLLDESGNPKTDPSTGFAMPFEKYFSETWLKENPKFRSTKAMSGSGTQPQNIASAEDAELQLRRLMDDFNSKKITNKEYSERAGHLQSLIIERQNR